MSAQTLVERLRGELLNCECCARSEGECCCDTLWPEGACRQAADHIEAQDRRIAELESAITKTLNENGHLADGDNCTLIELKRVMGDRS